jgi:hypothetical protein
MSASNTSSNDDVIGATAPTSTGDSAVKDPGSWVTGDEDMTGAQRSYLETLAREAGETLPGDLTKAQASEHIDRLQQATGRGADTSGPIGADGNVGRTEGHGSEI